MNKVLVVLLLLVSPVGLLAQVTNEDDPEGPQSREETKGPPRIFINCVHTRCYDDYLRAELSFFDFVRDRFVCDIEVLVTHLNTGAGGREYTLSFYGRGRFENKNDTLYFTTRKSDTDDLIRRQIVKSLKQGLVRFVLDSDDMEQVNIEFPARKIQPEGSTVKKDPWNFWVVDVSGNGSVNGESNRQLLSMTTDLRVNRITPKSKFNFHPHYHNQQNSYSVNGNNIRVRTVDYGVSSLYVRSVSEHWSVGGFYRAFHSIYQNIEFSQSIAPALEYSFFPVSEVTRRQLRWVYQTGLRSLRYIEPTIFDKTREMLPYHQLSGIFGVTQPWGTLSAHLTGYQFLHDRRKTRFSFDMDISWRVIEGLSIRANASASLINNQISLARSTIKAEDALLGGRQLPTTFNYRSSLGLSYTFGSINNSVVNPRFSNVGSN